MIPNRRSPITRVTPPNGASGVAVNAKVQVSAPVSAVSVGNTGLALAAGSTPVTGTVSASGSVITFRPCRWR